MNENFDLQTFNGCEFERRAVQMGWAKCKITRIIFGKSPFYYYDQYQ